MNEDEQTEWIQAWSVSNDCIYILNEFYMCALCDYVGGTLMPIIMRLFPLIDHHHISDMTSITDYRWQSEHGTPPCAMSDQACFTISIVRECACCLTQLYTSLRVHRFFRVYAVCGGQWSAPLYKTKKNDSILNTLDYCSSIIIIWFKIHFHIQQSGWCCALPVRNVWEADEWCFCVPPHQNVLRDPLAKYRSNFYIVPSLYCTKITLHNICCVGSEKGNSRLQCTKPHAAFKHVLIFAACIRC